MKDIYEIRIGTFKNQYFNIVYSKQFILKECIKKLLYKKIDQLSTKQGKSQKSVIIQNKEVEKIMSSRLISQKLESQLFLSFLLENGKLESKANYGRYW